MIGYFTPLEEGELLYSAIARTADLLYPTKSYRQIAEIILGSRHATFGCYLPNNSSTLLERIPQVSGVGRTQILEACAFHTITPFLVSEDRVKLEESIFFAERQGLRRWFTRKSSYLKYCLACAIEDAADNRPQIWRVEANHPLVSCCLKHRMRLIETSARISCTELHSPAKCITLTETMPEAASPIELHMASDIQWLLRQKSRFLPGFQNVAHVLHARLRKISKFRITRDRLNRSAVHEELRRVGLPDCVQTDPRAYSSVLSVSSRETIQRYSVLGYLAETTIAEIITEACSLTNLPVLDNSVITPVSLEIARTELTNYVRRHVGASRSTIRAGCPAADIVCRKDRPFYDRAMPLPRPKSLGRKIDWTARDLLFEKEIISKPDSLGMDARSIARILSAIGAPRSHARKLKKQLPRTWAAANAVKDTWITQRRRLGLPAFFNQYQRVSEDAFSQ